MRAKRSILTSFVAVLVLAGLVHACASTEGHSCRKSSDCESGLLCCGTGAEVTGGRRGTCQSTCTIGGSDAGQDAGHDAGQDAGQDAGDDASMDAATD